MNNDEVIDENEVQVKTSLNHSKLPIEINEKNDEESSDGSSPSALKKRLQELSSTYDNPLTPLLSHRISIINRSDKEDHQNSNRLDESSTKSNSLQGARARRRAKIRSEILNEIDQSLSMTNSTITTDLFNILTQSDYSNKLNDESSMESSLTQIYDGKDSSKFRFKANTFTGSMTSRSYYCKHDDDDDDDDNKKSDLIKRQSKSANDDRINKCNKLLRNKTKLNPISHLSTNNVRPIKCGGYRPNTGIILTNLSSSSESESINEPTTSNCLLKKINSPMTNTELSSPVSKTTLDERISNVLSSRSEDNQALSSFRSFQELSRNKLVNNNNNNNNNNNDLITVPSKSGVLISSRSKNVKQKNDLSDESNINSINLSKHLKGKMIEHLSCQSSAKNCIEREEEFLVSRTNTARYFNEDHSLYENNQETMSSFLNVGLNDDLETFNASDNERQDNNTTSVPSLRLYSEDVSCSTSAGSKTYTQNRSLDSSVLSNALSNVCSTLNTKDKDNNSTRTRYRSYDDSEHFDTSESSDQNLILMKNYEVELPMVTTDSKNYDEFDIIDDESRRAFSAPHSKLPTKRLVDDRRCKSVDLSNHEMIYVKENHQYSESLYSNLSKTNLSESIESLNITDDYHQTLKEPIEMSYLQEEKYNPFNSEYTMYPRQSHLSILQEESETKLEEYDLSESTFENKESLTVNIDQENSVKLNESNLIQNTIENSMNVTTKQSNRTNFISTFPSNNKQDDKINDIYEKGDNEYKKMEDKSLDDKFDKNNLSESKTMSVEADTTMLIIKNIHECECTCVSPKVSSSTSRLLCTFEHNNNKSPRLNYKKSQERFPFTISETESTIVDPRQNVGRCNSVTNKSRSLETFRELTYPSIIEFFNSSIECYAYNNERQRDQRNILPKMKGLVRRFSNKLKSSRKQNNTDHRNEISTKIIYQNQECQIDSIPESCSDESTIEQSQLIEPKSGNTRSSIISSGKSLKKTMSLENLTLCKEYPRRRYDRDDKWVKEFEECSSQRTTSRTTLSKEHFSMFTSKSESSSLVEDLSFKQSMIINENNILSDTRKNDEDSMTNVSTSFVLLPNSKETKVVNVQNDQQNPDTDELSINMENNGCICLKFYRMLTCSYIITTKKHRSSIIKPKTLIEMKKKKRKKTFGLSSK